MNELFFEYKKRQEIFFFTFWRSNRFQHEDVKVKFLLHDINVGHKRINCTKRLSDVPSLQTLLRWIHLFV